MIELAIVWLFMCAAPIAMFSMGIKAIRSGSHVERGTLYTGREAMKIGWYYICAGLLATVLVLIAGIWIDWPV
jgi:hypothetical protein